MLDEVITCSCSSSTWRWIVSQQPHRVLWLYGRNWMRPFSGNHYQRVKLSGCVYCYLQCHKTTQGLKYHKASKPLELNMSDKIKPPLLPYNRNSNYLNLSISCKWSSECFKGDSIYLNVWKVTHPREECPRLIATLHRVLQTVKESAEKIRAFEIVSVKMWKTTSTSIFRSTWLGWKPEN